MRFFIVTVDNLYKRGYNSGMKCNICPRQCNIDRKTAVGYCGVGENAVVAKSMLHMFEEPVISGKNGSGAVFFSGCNLRCVFCQNSAISRHVLGKTVQSSELADMFFELEDRGAHNINLVTATHYLSSVIPALEVFKARSSLPVVYNCGGYESVESIKRLEGLVDVFLPDFKYCDNELAKRLSFAPDYKEVALSAIGEMVRQQPQIVIEDGLIKKGVIIRHLVLPSYIQNSLDVVKTINEKFPSALLSLMSQYTPSFYKGEDKNLKRKLTTFEYNKVLKVVEELGIEGFCQYRSSATSEYTPDF
ncbi:MAG: radical SAM protein [Clostridia bacterium]|nr:radical SAM protein [Clostridia bacterium]